MPKTAVLQLFHNQNPKCAIFSKENMILIKDRHHRWYCVGKDDFAGKYDTYKGSTPSFFGPHNNKFLLWEI